MNIDFLRDGSDLEEIPSAGVTFQNVTKIEFCNKKISIRVGKRNDGSLRSEVS